MDQLQIERRVTIAGMVLNILLSGGKILAGIIARSSAIIADGLHSFSDLASDIMVLWGIRAAKMPPDEDHHYGHFRYEAVTALLVGVLLCGAALFIAGEAIYTISQRHGGVRSWLPFYIAVGSIVTKELLYWWTRAVGRKFNNPAIIANAWHHRSDAFSSIAAAAGIAGALIGGERWSFLDHLTAVLLASFLVYIGVKIVRDAWHRLSDRAPQLDTQQEMKSAIQGIPGVRGFHAFRARHAGAGNKIEMDVHIQVDPSISVQQGHQIASQVEQEIRRINPDVTGIVVHVEPEEEQE
ncbi:MAG: cation diffusion facilitator family transporter [candidate division WOR-3 bacterium]